MGPDIRSELPGCPRHPIGIGTLNSSGYIVGVAKLNTSYILKFRGQFPSNLFNPPKRRVGAE